ncbi:MAG: hypothetical protein Fur002_07980 [Anaerolineales bacterium]
MSKLFFGTKHKSKAQAMLEFALVLPILLMLIYGILETGRLLFIYASTVTAARQAARYGSATGVNPGNNLPYYEDCNGIEGAARRLEFIHRFATIDISYDGGVQDSNGDKQIDEVTEAIPLNPASPACGAYTTAVNGDRIIVEVTTLWQPIVPLVPLRPFTISARSERTILATVDIFVDVTPPPFVGAGGAAQLVLTSVASGDTITYTYEVTNIGNDVLDASASGGIQVTGTKGTMTSCNPPATLNILDKFTCTGSYTATLQDFNAGYVINTGSVTPASAASTDTEFTPLTQNAVLQLTITPNKQFSLTDVTYTYLLENKGNVTVFNPSITDLPSIAEDASGLICQGGSSLNASGVLPLQLDPGQSITCNKFHPISQAERDAGVINNNGTGSAVFNHFDGMNGSTPTYTSTAVSDSATAEVITSPLYLTVTGRILPSPFPTSAPYPAQQIEYTFAIRNNDAVALNLTSVVLNSFSGFGTPPAVNCALPRSIPAGGLYTCPVSLYNVTQADLDNVGAGVGLPISIQATATASGYTSTTSIYPVDLYRKPSLTITATTNPSLVLTAPTIVDYTYVITNTGNVTLQPPSGGFEIVDTAISGVITCTDANTAIPPGTTGNTKTCTAQREVSATELNSVIVGDVSVSGLFGSSAYAATTRSVISTYDGPRLQLDIETPSPVVTGAGVTIPYTYILTNTGNVTLSTTADSTPFDFTNYKGTPPQSCDKTTLAIGESATCTGSYVTKSTDFNTYVRNDAYAIAYTPSNQAQNSNAPGLEVYVVAPDYCSVNHGTFTVTPNFGMSIINNNDFEVELASVYIKFNDDPNKQQITELKLGNNIIFASTNTSMAGEYTFTPSGVKTIPARTAYNLFVTAWNPANPVNGVYTPASPQIERMEVTFTNPNCITLASDVVVPVPKANLEVTKTNSKSTVDIGETFDYTITATNNGPDAVTAAKLTDPTASGISVLSVTCSALAGNKCSGVVTPSQLRNGIALPTMASGDKYQIFVTAKVTAPTAGTLVRNTVNVDPPGGVEDNITTNNTAYDEDSVTKPNADIVVTKTNNATDIKSGDVTHYIINVTNNGASTISGIKLQDAAVSGLSKINSITCTGLLNNQCQTAPNVSSLQNGVLIPTLTSGQSYEIDVPATVMASSGTVNNTAKIIVPSIVEGNNTANDTAIDGPDNVIPSIDLGIAKTHGSLPISAGGTVTYTITVTNNRGDVAAGSTLTDAPSAAMMTVTTVNCTGGALNQCTNGNKPTPAQLAAGWSLPALANSQTYEIAVTANVNAAGGALISNTATIAQPGGAPDDNPANDSATDSATVQQGADLAIVKGTVGSVTSINAGANIQYTLTVTNNGPLAAGGAKVRDPGVTNFNYNGAATVTCGSASGGAVCPGGLTIANLQGSGIVINTLPSGGSLVFTVTGKFNPVDASLLPSGISRTNTATVSHDTVNDPNPGNNSSNYAVTVVSACANGQVSISNPASQSGSTSYTWTINNPLSIPLTLTQVKVSFTISSNGKLDKVYVPAATLVEDVNLSAGTNVSVAVSPTVSVTGNSTIKLLFTKTATVSDVTLVFAETGCNNVSNP